MEKYSRQHRNWMQSWEAEERKEAEEAERLKRWEQVKAIIRQEKEAAAAKVAGLAPAPAPAPSECASLRIDEGSSLVFWSPLLNALTSALCRILSSVGQ